MLVMFDGAAFHAERKRSGFSQAALAIKIDSSIRHIRALEKSEKTNPSAGLVCKAAVALQVPMETFMRVQVEEHDESV